MQVTISGRTFEVREAMIGAVIDHMQLLSENPSKFQQLLAQASVYENGVLLGESLMQSVSVKGYIELISAVMRVNGFSGDAEGNA